MFACNGRVMEEKEKETKPVTGPGDLIEANKLMVKSEDQRIEDFIRRYGWQMETKGSGLRYMIYHEGKGEKADAGKIAMIDYTLSLLSGDTVYTSENEGIKSIPLGKGTAESGLEEGILLLNVGDKAKFIIPSHLAFGLFGDAKKVPAKATLVYDIELIELK